MCPGEWCICYKKAKYFCRVVHIISRCIRSYAIVQKLIDTDDSICLIIRTVYENLMTKYNVLDLIIRQCYRQVLKLVNGILQFRTFHVAAPSDRYRLIQLCIIKIDWVHCLIITNQFLNINLIEPFFHSFQFQSLQ